MKKAKLVLTSQEIRRARNYNIEVEVGKQEDTNMYHCVLEHSSVTTLLDFLATITDLSDYSIDELIEYYITES